MEQIDKHPLIEPPIIEIKNDDHTFIRIISREEDDGTSDGILNICRVGEKSSYIHDWFHTLAAFSTGKLILVIFFTYIISVFFWGTVYYFSRSQGFVDINSYVAALFISLETMTTIGYTVTDITGHWLAFVLVFAQALQGILMSSFSIGLIYTRLSRGKTRAKTILFTDHAILRKINGVWHFIFQVCDRRKHQVLQPSIHIYCCQHTYNEQDKVRYQLSYMAQYAEHDRDVPLFLALPNQISHVIDKNSPLFPDYIKDYKDLTAENIIQNIREKELEIMVLLDCAEPVTSNNFQARISYIYDEIESNVIYAPCVGQVAKYQTVCIDLDKFNETIPITEESQPIENGLQSPNSYMQTKKFYRINSL
ncbi:hypothetical protein WA158_008007 [Blastocystis sp. Blastoise]